MKIITLIPVKNESWILPITLPQLTQVSDEVIILDDNSEDDTVKIASAFDKVQVITYLQDEKYVNMSDRRNKLLQIGRQNGGTHFIFIDADELLSQRAIDNLAEHIKSLKPGESLAFPWINLSEKNTKFFYQKTDRQNYKDFVFCDDKTTNFPDVFLSEQRTPALNKNWLKIPFEKGAVLHLQFINKLRYQYKQAWYRMQEFIAGKRNALRINTTYLFTKDLPLGDTLILDKNINKLSNFDFESYQVIKKQVYNLFDKKGVEYFEALDIWHIPDLRNLFIEKVGREPKPFLAPKWLLSINDLKNKFKNYLS